MRGCVSEVGEHTQLEARASMPVRPGLNTSAPTHHVPGKMRPEFLILNRNVHGWNFGSTWWGRSLFAADCSGHCENCRSGVRSGNSARSIDIQKGRKVIDAQATNLRPHRSTQQPFLRPTPAFNHNQRCFLQPYAYRTVLRPATSKSWSKLTF
jgi:hypothetical protein